MALIPARSSHAQFLTPGSVRSTVGRATLARLRRAPSASRPTSQAHWRESLHVEGGTLAQGTGKIAETVECVLERPRQELERV